MSVTFRWDDLELEHPPRQTFREVPYPATTDTSRPGPLLLGTVILYDHLGHTLSACPAYVYDGEIGVAPGIATQGGLVAEIRLWNDERPTFWRLRNSLLVTMVLNDEPIVETDPIHLAEGQPFLFRRISPIADGAPPWVCRRLAESRQQFARAI